jgi:hypothetical protein
MGARCVPDGSIIKPSACRQRHWTPVALPDEDPRALVETRGSAPRPKEERPKEERPKEERPKEERPKEKCARIGRLC